jgi:ornithine decarboxylase
MAEDQNYDESSSSKIHYLNFNNQKSVKAKTRTSVGVAKKNSLSPLPFIDKKVSSLKPSLPVYFIRPATIKRAVNFFLEAFSSSKHESDVLYSVKSNPDEAVLRHLFDGGIRHFDVASLAEVKLIDALFGKEAKMYFMHPIKSREAIKEAYFEYGIRDFVLDCPEELKKIKEVTKNAPDLGLHLRLSVSNSNAIINLSSKFGILPSKATSLARRVRASAARFGICFHVGSQCMDPIEYRNAIMLAKNVVKKAKVKLDVLDIGGGFPSTYPGMTPPNLQSYFDEIFDAISQISLNTNCRLWCEPGRALVAEAGSLLVRVEGKKDAMLYLNDGTYGGLFDAGFPNFIYPARAIRVKGRTRLSETLAPFGFYGPTCDSIDVMKGPFQLPENISDGDYIEIGQLGAYSRSIRTSFNGFDESLQIEVADEPLQSMFTEEKEEEKITKDQA